MAGSWICMMVNANYRRGDKKAAAAELCRVFGDDVLEVRIMCGKATDALEEYYAFVKCSNYHSHLESVSTSAAVAGVVPSYEEPSRLSDAEVDEFIESMHKSESPKNVAHGDIVTVTKGYLSGLYGIVVSVSGKHCLVKFKFHTREFSKSIPLTDLNPVDSVFAHLRCPVTEESMKEMASNSASSAEDTEATIGCRDKVCREPDRKCEVSGRT